MIVLAEVILSRLAARLADGGALLDWGGCLRLSAPEGAMIDGRDIGQTAV